MSHADQQGLAPITGAERIGSLDILRGFALLGILLMNIKTFAMIGAAYFFPTAYGDLTGANLVVWWANDLFASRKFMTLFSLLFGAGVVLQTGRAAAVGLSIRGLWYRRIFWLWVFGMLHAYLFWEGDILVTYAVCALLLYPMRTMKPWKLLAVGLVVLAIGSFISLGWGLSAKSWTPQNVEAFTQEWQPSPEKVTEELEAMRGSWVQEIRHRFPKVLELHLMVIPFHLLWRGMGVMLMGMALYKWKLLSGGLRRTHIVWMVLGVFVGLPVSAWGAWRQFASGWEPISAFLVDSQFGYWASLLVALGWAGLVFVFIERRWLLGLQTRLAAIGRTALSNYLLQTLLCTTLFYGRGFGIFGEVSRIGQMGVVLAVWVLQLWLAPWWLKRFRFGPAEWLWRSLTYWQRQPMRR